ncbi:MAG: peptidylprolyl isomerase [Planctomycetota bacterium]
MTLAWLFAFVVPHLSLSAVLSGHPPPLAGVLTARVMPPPDGADRWLGGEAPAPTGSQGPASGRDRPATPPQKPPVPGRGLPWPEKPLPTVQPTVPLPAGVMARIDGRDVTLEAYKRYLFENLDLSRFIGFVDELLIEARAAELGIALGEEELDEAVERHMQRIIEKTYRGDQGRFEAVLASRLKTISGYREWQKRLLAPKLLRERCVMALRVVTPEQVRGKFEEMYGPDGVHRQIRHLLIRKGSSTAGGEGETSREKAHRLAAILRDDPSRFEEVVREHSEDHLTRGNDGLLPNYRPGPLGYGKDFDLSILALEEEGQVAGPAESSQGFHIIQLVKKTVTRLEDVEKALQRDLQNRRPTPQELQDLMKRLRREVRIEM